MANKELQISIEAEPKAVPAVVETAVAETPEAAAVDNPNRVSFSHPYEWDGTMIDHLDVDLTKVSGKDCKTIARMLESTGEINPMAVLPEFSIPYILQLVAYAVRMPVEFMEQLDWPDVMKLKVKVISFFGA